MLKSSKWFKNDVKKNNEIKLSRVLATKKLQDITRKGLVKISLDAWRNIVKITPVELGTLKSGWEVNVDDDSFPSPVKPGKGDEPAKIATEQEVLDRINAKTGEIKFDSIISFWNAVFYCEYVEQGTEKSPAQPMVEPTSKLVQDQLEKLAEAINKLVI